MLSGTNECPVPLAASTSRAFSMSPVEHPLPSNHYLGSSGTHAHEANRLAPLHGPMCEEEVHRVQSRLRAWSSRLHQAQAPRIGAAGASKANCRTLANGEQGEASAAFPHFQLRRRSSVTRGAPQPMTILEQRLAEVIDLFGRQVGSQYR